MEHAPVVDVRDGLHQLRHKGEQCGRLDNAATQATAHAAAALAALPQMSCSSAACKPSNGPRRICRCPLAAGATAASRRSRPQSATSATLRSTHIDRHLPIQRHIHAPLHIHGNSHAHLHVQVHANVHLHLHENVHIHLHVHVYVHLHVRVHAHAQCASICRCIYKYCADTCSQLKNMCAFATVPIHARSYILTHAFVYMYTCMHVRMKQTHQYTPIHTHVQTQRICEWDVRFAPEMAP